MKHWGRILLALMLCAAMTAGMLPGTLNTARADKWINGLGTGNLCQNYEVSYGYYSGDEPMIYRILELNTTEYGGTTMLLDSIYTLYNFQIEFDYNQHPQDATNVWADCSLRAWLNGDDFLNNPDIFTDAERDAIAFSTKAAPSAADGTVVDNAFDKNAYEFTPLNNDRIFIMDALELMRYWPADQITLRQKGGNDYWTRSKYIDGSQKIKQVWSAVPHVHSFAACSRINVSPTFNVNLSSIIFTTIDTGGGIFTLLDNRMSISADASGISRDGNTVTVPYTITGDNAGNADRVTVLILDSEYVPGKAATDGFTYLKLSVDNFGTSGTGTFTLPDKYASKACGTDYWVYILAEDERERYYTDSASAPVSITVPAAPAREKATPKAVPKTGDSGNPVLWSGMVLLGIAGLAVLSFLKVSRKRK